MTTHSEELVSLEELRSVLNSHAGPDNPRQRPSSHGLRRVRPLLVAAVAVAALAGAGLAIADGLGAFTGISAAQNTQVGADVLPAGIAAIVQQANAKAGSPALLPDTARVLGTMPDGSKVYGLTNSNGDLCLFGEAGGGCGPPLSQSQPTTFSIAWPTTADTLIVSGVAIDGVTSISFNVEPGGNEVTVPVTHNVWIYKEATSQVPEAHCMVAHFADGATVTPSFPGVPCP